MGRGKSYLEESHEGKERTVCRNGQKEGSGGVRAINGGDHNRYTSGAKRDFTSGHPGESNDHDAEQVLLQYEGAHTGGTGTPQATVGEVDGGEEGHRGNG